MALIQCPECNKEVSNKAEVCPNCGFPINRARLSKEFEQEQHENFEFPKLPDDLSIGKKYTNWTYDVLVNGFFSKADNIVDCIPEGKVQVQLFHKGIGVYGRASFRAAIEIHYSQIINLYATTIDEIVTMNSGKSVIGRSIAGGLLFGPFGALLAGMSGIGEKAVNLGKEILIINYWDLKSKSPFSIIIHTNDGFPNYVSRFLNRFEKEIQEYRMQSEL